MMRLLKMDALTDEAAAKLRPLFNAHAWPKIVADIAAGRADLFQCPGRTFAVLRLDDDELVIVGVCGRDAVALFETALQIAQANGLRAVRWHTESKGLARLLGRYGPVEVERVYRVIL